MNTRNVIYSLVTLSYIVNLYSLSAVNLYSTASCPRFRPPPPVICKQGPEHCTQGWAQSWRSCLCAPGSSPATAGLVTQPCPTLSDPMDCNPLGFSTHGTLQARILEWAVMPPSRSSQPRDWTGSPALQVDSLPPQPHVLRTSQHPTFSACLPQDWCRYTQGGCF